MKRIQTALRKGRCVLAIGERALRDGQPELAKRPTLPVVKLGGAAIDPDALAPATTRGGGIVVLVEPDPMADGRSLEALAKVLKKAKQKPSVYVLAPVYNPFGLPIPMRLMRLEHVKARASDLLTTLPVGGEAATADAPKKKKKGPSGPRIVLAGREEEVQPLQDALAVPGALLLVGPTGVGRTWLLDTAISKMEGVVRWPDLQLNRASGFNNLTSLIAEATGDEALQAALRSPTAIKPGDLIDATVAALANEAHAGRVMVIRGIEGTLLRDGSQARRDRLGLLLEALLTRPLQATLVFMTSVVPELRVKGHTHRTLTVGGLRGRELFTVFESYGADEVPRDKMGEVYNQTGGHPMATRIYAVAWRDSDNRAQLLDNKNFLKLSQADNLEPLVKYVGKRIEKLLPQAREALVLVGHSPVPLTGKELSDLGISRETRLELTRSGLLDASILGEPRTYHVHRLVKGVMGVRVLTDFDTLLRMVELLDKRVANLDGVARLALGQELNAMRVLARRGRDRPNTGYPDHDAVLAGVRDMTRARNARLDLALQRVNGAIKRDPSNTELLLAKAEVVARMDGDKNEEVVSLLRQAAESCPTPEVFHWEANWRMRRKRKGDLNRAIEALVKGRTVFPTESTLARRLGAVLHEQNRSTEAEKVLREALELAPGDAETYARLGSVLSNQGPERWEDAENALRYAIELEPEFKQHGGRLATLLRRRADLATEGRDALLAEAKDLLEAALKDKPNSPQPYLELAQLLLDSGGDLERAGWAAKRAAKQSQRNDPTCMVLLARIETRSGKLAEAERRLQKALKVKGHEAAAHAGLAELYFAQSKVFAADQELGLALQLSKPGSAAHAGFKREKAKIEALITSGQALEIEKQTQLSEEEASRQASLERAGFRPEPVVRRKGGKPDAPAPPIAEAPGHLPTLAPAAAAPAPPVAEPAPAAEPAQAEPAAAPAEPAPAEAPPAEPAPAEPAVEPAADEDPQA